MPGDDAVIASLREAVRVSPNNAPLRSPCPGWTPGPGPLSRYALQMAKRGRLLDVGNCAPDHMAIRSMLERHFDVQVERVMFVDDALKILRDQPFDLVLVNRLIFDGGSPGMALIEKMQADPELKKVPVMMISNYADAQAAAEAAGAKGGFGKAAINAPGTVELLAPFLPRREKANGT